MSLPEFFEPLLAQQYSEADIKRIKDGYRAQRNVTLRANTLSSSKDEVASELDSAGIAWSGVDWYDDAFVIEKSSSTRTQTKTFSTCAPHQVERPPRSPP